MHIRDPPNRDRSSRGVTPVGPSHRRKHELKVCNGPCHGTNDSEHGERPQTLWKVACSGHTAIGWLKTADAAEVGWYAYGTAGIAAHTRGGKACRNRRCFATA